jgi:hypothetical protein
MELGAQPLLVAAEQAFEQHQIRGGRAHMVKAEQHDRARDRGHRLAAGAKRHSVGQTQQSMRERHVRQDHVGQRLQTIVLAFQQARQARQGVAERRQPAMFSGCGQHAFNRS